MDKENESRVKKLEIKKIKERVRKAKIKSDPIEYELYKEKDRQRYAKKKAEGKILKLNERPRHVQKAMKEMNRVSSKKHYYNKKRAVLNEIPIVVPTDKVIENTSDPLQESIIPSSSTLSLRQTSSPLTCPPVANFHLSSPVAGTSGVQKPLLCTLSSPSRSSPLSFPNFTDTFVDSSVPMSPSESDSSCNHTLRSRRQKQNDTFKAESRIVDTPKSRPPSKNVGFRKYKYRVNKEFKLLHDRISELRASNLNYKKMIIRLRKKEFEMREKYCREMLKNASTDELESSATQTTAVKSQIQMAVHNFYEDDENSRMCPGKKDCVTKSKLKKQKRYLNDSLYNLHKKYQRENPETNASYSFFCKLRPFWIQTPKINTRETCLCEKHENFQLITLSLKKHNIIAESSTNEILEALCCDATNVNCLQRKCEKCRERQLNYSDFDNSDKIDYTTWTKEKKNMSKMT